MLKVGINGFGRIGRLSFRILCTKKNIKVVAINSLSSPSTLAHLLKYDSVHGRFTQEVTHTENALIVAGKTIPVFTEKDPSNLPWARIGADIILEATGKFRDAESLSKHLKAGAQHVVVSAPIKGNIPTVVLGVNDYVLIDKPAIVSNASCTTNCLAPIAKVLDENFGIVQGYLNTIHAYTGDQRLIDGSHKDLRRARAAAHSIIPTTTGAAKTLGLVLPHLKGKVDGMATRVPVSNGSLVDFTVLLKKQPTIASINAAMKRAATGSLKGILSYTEDPIVSADVIGDTHSCIFDGLLTSVNGNLVKVVGWYDNEAGYAQRMVDIIEKLA